jgi:hypothetical protein
MPTVDASAKDRLPSTNRISTSYSLLLVVDEKITQRVRSGTGRCDNPGE